jgi:hypothetical protein
LSVAVIVVTLYLPSPTWYSLATKWFVVPVLSYTILGDVSGILGVILLNKYSAISKIMLYFYRLQNFFTSIFAAFLCEYVAWVGMLESAVALMNGFYFDFEEIRIQKRLIYTKTRITLS